MWNPSIILLSWLEVVFAIIQISLITSSGFVLSCVVLLCLSGILTSFYAQVHLHGSTCVLKSPLATWLYKSRKKGNLGKHCTFTVCLYSCMFCKCVEVYHSTLLHTVHYTLCLVMTGYKHMTIHAWTTFLSYTFFKYMYGIVQ